MKRIRLGNTVDIVWEIFLGKDKDKGKYDLTGKKLTIYLVSAFDRIKISDFTTEFNVLRFTFEGKDQKHQGRYQLTFVENEGGDDTRTLDKCDAFELVKGSCLETDDLSEITLASSFDALRIYPIIPQVGPNRNWWVDGVDTGKSSVGLTAYEFAKEQGYEGTEEEYAAECLAVPVLNEESREATEAATKATEAATVATKSATDAAESANNASEEASTNASQAAVATASANEAAERANEAAEKAEETIEAFGSVIANKADKIKFDGKYYVETDGISTDDFYYSMPDSADGTEDDIIATKSNLKKINGQELYGKGNIVIEGKNYDKEIAEQSAKLTQLSEEMSDDKSFLYNPFTKKGMAFAESDAVPSYWSYANADSSEYLVIPSRIKGKAYLATGTTYKISFMDANGKFVSNYQAPTTGFQDIDIKKEDLPSNAHYMVVTTYAAYSSQSYLLFEWYPFIENVKELPNDVATLSEKVEKVGSQVNSSFEMAANARLSKGVACQSGKVLVSLSITDGANSNLCDIYRYVNGVFNSEKLLSGAELGKSYYVDVPEGDSGIWLFLNGGASAYTIECSITSGIYSLVKELENNLENKEDAHDVGYSWSGKTIVCFGDSLTENGESDTKKRYSDYIEELTGASVINVGVGGTQLRQRTTPVANPSNSTQAYAALDIVNMVKAACEQEFSKQVSAASYLATNVGDDNRTIVERLSNIDWSKVDAVTFFAGTNDWNNDSSPWGDADSSDINVTFGAINEIVRMIMTTYPHIKIYWFSPIVRWLASSLDERISSNWSDIFERGGTTLKEFSANLMSVVASNHLPICDMYNTLGWNMYNFSLFFNDNDGTHPRKGGGNLILAKKMVGFIAANRTF